MAGVAVDLEGIMMALEDNTGAEYYLDLESGDVLRFSADPGLNEDLEREFGEAMENNPARFRHIEPISSSQSFQVMADFVESLPESKAKEVLSRVLGGSRPFRNFKDALLSFPDVREQWFRYHDGALKEFVLSWLRDEEIEVDIR
jgi:Uncharacterised protein family (UPF0158)